VSASPPWILLGNGRVAVAFLRAVLARGDRPRRIVLNAPDRQRDAEALRALASGAGIAVAEWSAAEAEALRGVVEDPGEPWIVSVYFGHKVPTALLDAAGGRAINLHASLLPWNRGVHTNVWPIVERTPAGVSLHVMSPGIDEGPLLVQREVAVGPADTAATLYGRIEDAAAVLIIEAWPAGVRAAWPGWPQDPGGSSHVARDLAKLDGVDLDAQPALRDFFNLLRARSFPPHAGVIVRLDGRRVEAVLHLKDVTDD
jgi:methionyl-tRNA formyltransferase